MLERKTGFWEEYNSPLETPMGFVIKHVQPGQVVDFALGMKALAATISQINPDVIFLPERGALPLWWSASEFLRAQSTVSFPKIVNLAIGEGVDNVTNKYSGIQDFQKGEIVKQQMQILVDQGIEIKRPLLIDEAHTGSTLTHAARHLASAFTDLGMADSLRILAIQDNRGNILKRRKYHGFVRLVTNTIPNFQTSMLTIPLFYVDRRSLLNHLVRPEANNPGRSHLMTMTIHNTEAEQTFKNLIAAVTHPKILGDILTNNPAEQNRNDENREIYERLTEWLESLKSELQPELQSSEAVTDWFKDLSSHALEHGIQ